MFEDLKAKGFSIEFRNHSDTLLKHAFRPAIKDIEAVLLKMEAPIIEIIESGGPETPLVQRTKKDFNGLNWNKKNFINTIISSDSKNSPEIIKENDKEVKIRSDGEILFVNNKCSHEIDHAKKIKGKILALEIEWNSKDSVFIRDLSTFSRLYIDGVISIGIIVTRGKELHEGMEKRINEFANTKKLKNIGDLDKISPKYNITKSQKTEIEKKLVSKSASLAEAWAKVFVNNKYGEATTHWKKLIENMENGTGDPCPVVAIGLPPTVVTEK